MSWRPTCPFTTRRSPTCPSPAPQAKILRGSFYKKFARLIFIVYNKNNFIPTIRPEHFTPAGGTAANSINPNQERLSQLLFKVCLKEDLELFNYNGKESSERGRLFISPGEHLLRFVKTQQGELYLAPGHDGCNEESLHACSHPLHVFSRAQKTTTMHNPQVPVTEFHIQVPKGNNLQMSLIGTMDSALLPEGHHVLVRYKDDDRFLVLRESLKTQAQGITESRWLWLWFSQIWESWQMSLLKVGNVTALHLPQHVSLPELEEADSTAASG